MLENLAINDIQENERLKKNMANLAVGKAQFWTIPADIQMLKISMCYVS